MKSRYLLLILPIFAISGCTTPKTMLQNPSTGQIVHCGGNVSSSLAGGAIGYHIQKSNDAECKSNYLEQGFKVVKEED